MMTIRPERLWSAFMMAVLPHKALDGEMLVLVNDKL